MMTKDERVLTGVFNEMVKRARSRPWVMEGINRAANLEGTGLPWILTTPSDVFAEMTLGAMMMVSPDVEIVDQPGPHSTSARLLFAELHERATPVLWEEDIHDAARKAKVPPCRWSCDSINPPIQYWTFPRELMSDNGKKRLQSIIVVNSDALRTLSMVEDDGVWTTQKWTDFFLIMHTSDDYEAKKIEVNRFTIIDGTEYPHAFEWSPKLVASMGDYFSMAAFVSSPYIPSETIALPKEKRKKWSRSTGIAECEFPRARFLTLRRLRHEAEHTERPDGLGPATESGRVYTRSWLREMHLRNQAHGPGWSQHKLILIPPTLFKADLPFVPRVNKVAR